MYMPQDQDSDSRIPVKRVGDIGLNFEDAYGRAGKLQHLGRVASGLKWGGAAESNSRLCIPYTPPRVALNPPATLRLGDGRPANLVCHLGTSLRDGRRAPGISTDWEQGDENIHATRGAGY
ncbi:hypothetical protein DFH09DRAFT_1071353 [Mycena vulgaris]|nr:hypothetical protein DFH09DRAFT_1071353 [Mycena vulgaris]